MVIGEIKQYKGSFDPGEQIQVNGYGRIGISIDEDDFMQLGENQPGFGFQINGQDIYIGKTFMYETEYPVGNQHTVITFPNGAPSSTLVNIVCGAKYTES